MARIARPGEERVTERSAVLTGGNFLASRSPLRESEILALAKETHLLHRRLGLLLLAGLEPVEELIEQLRVVVNVELRFGAAAQDFEHSTEAVGRQEYGDVLGLLGEHDEEQLFVLQHFGGNSAVLAEEHS